MARRKYRKSRPVEPPIPPPMPRTLMGRFLRASMLRQSSEREPLTARFPEFSSLGSVHVMIAAFQIAVARLFEPNTGLKDVSLLVSDMRRAFGPELPSLETEALIRFEMGEDVAIGDLSVRTKTSAMILTLGTYADFVERNQAEVDGLLLEAEQRAFDRGHHPELAE
ncbi:hypothetical protein GA0070613_3507 [Micromonospora inositola]|uniref:Uncharacterized protein n=2 Tax=Micromonospora inositola TaxID=47865 RepID=A0A1C5IV48_9ACTN|nr:hypothetical protein GA0070613_3507 [Micromonospora inositola]